MYLSKIIYVRKDEKTRKLNVWKENIGSRNSPRYNKVWNRIKDGINKVRSTKNLLQSKTKVRNSKQVYKKAKEKTNRAEADLNF